jgi:hypothetical protein
MPNRVLIRQVWAGGAVSAKASVAECPQAGFTVEGYCSGFLRAIYSRYSRRHVAP